MTRHDTPHDERLAELLGADGPAVPAPDLVQRIMAGIDASERGPESVVDRWNRIAGPVALAAGLAALVCGFAMLGEDDPAVADPIAVIVADDEPSLDPVLAISRR